MAKSNKQSVGAFVLGQTKVVGVLDNQSKVEHVELNLNGGGNTYIHVSMNNQHGQRLEYQIKLEHEGLVIDHIVGDDMQPLTNIEHPAQDDEGDWGY